MKRLVSVLIIFLFVLVGCAPKAMTYFNEEEAKLENYLTYRLLNTKRERTNLSKDGREILDLIESTVRRKMKERGYEESNLSPDLILRYEIITNQRSENGTRSGVSGTPVSSRTFFESLIIIDLLDIEKRKMFWQGSFDLRQQSKPLKHEQAVESAINEIYYSYPYMAESFEPSAELSDAKTGRKQLKTRFKRQKEEEKELKKQRKRER